MLRCGTSCRRRSTMRLPMRARPASPFGFSVVTHTLINPWSRWSSGSAIRLQHEAVTGLACCESGEGLVADSRGLKLTHSGAHVLDGVTGTRKLHCEVFF